MLEFSLLLAPILSLIILQPQVAWKRGTILFIFGLVVGTLTAGRMFDAYFPLWNFPHVFIYSLKQVDIIFAAICLLMLKREQAIVFLAAFFTSRAFFANANTALITAEEIIFLILQRCLILTLLYLTVKKEMQKILSFIVACLLLLFLVLAHACFIFFNNTVIAIAFLLTLQFLIFVYLILKGKNYGQKVRARLNPN